MKAKVFTSKAAYELYFAGDESEIERVPVAVIGESVVFASMITTCKHAETAQNRFNKTFAGVDPELDAVLTSVVPTVEKLDDNRYKVTVKQPRAAEPSTAYPGIEKAAAAESIERVEQYNARVSMKEDAKAGHAHSVAAQYTDTLKELARVAAAPAIEKVEIDIEITHSSAYGYNARAEIGVYAGGKYMDYCYTTPRNSGGYDKVSTAVAHCFNECDPLLKLLYNYQESALAHGVERGANNANTIAYGAGYGAQPYFEEGIGVSALRNLLTVCGGHWVDVLEKSNRRVYTVNFMKEGD
jgi:hypothetical protein